VTDDVPFPCPSCRHGLRLRAGYFRVLYLLALVFIALIAYAAGRRGDELFATVLLGLLPTHLLLLFVTMRLFPPDVESTGDYRDILYPTNTEDVSDASEWSGRPAAEPETNTQVLEGSDRQTMFKAGAQHRTLEGVALRVGGVLLGLWVVWTAARPLVHRVLPELGATKTGPPGFPVTVHLGEESVEFTNGATESWACQVALGVRTAYVSTFSLEPGHTRTLSYLGFRGPGTQVGVAVVRSAARDRILMYCREPSGRTHFWQFN
jgi:hypothetical protein